MLAAPRQLKPHEYIPWRTGALFSLIQIKGMPLSAKRFGFSLITIWYILTHMVNIIYLFYLNRTLFFVASLSPHFSVENFTSTNLIFGIKISKERISPLLIIHKFNFMRLKFHNIFETYYQHNRSLEKYRFRPTGERQSSLRKCRNCL